MINLWQKRVWFISGMLLVFTTLFPIRGFTDCIACFQLKGFAITLNDERVVKGHMTLNDSWVTGWIKTEKKFPDIVFELGKDGDVWVYTHLKSMLNVGL